MVESFNTGRKKKEEKLLVNGMLCVHAHMKNIKMIIFPKLIKQGQLSLAILYSYKNDLASRI